MGREQPPESPPAGESEPCCFHCAAPTRRGGDPTSKSLRQKHLQPGAQRLGEHRRCTVGGDADHQRRAIDDGAEGEVAKSRLVDHIDRNARLASGSGKGCGIAVIVAVTDRKRAAVEVERIPFAPIQGQSAARRTGCERKKLVGRTRRIDMHVRSGGAKQFRLPGRGGAATRHQGSPTLKRKEYR
jgi:hypothetical protein